MPTGRRAGELTDARRRLSDKRGRETRNNGARAYVIGRRSLPVSCPARVLIDDFHHIRHLTAPPPPRFVCLGAPLATCALPKGVCYLLTYLIRSRASDRGLRLSPTSRVVRDCGYTRRFDRSYVPPPRTGRRGRTRTAAHGEPRFAPLSPEGTRAATRRTPGRRVEPWLSSCRAVEAPSSRCRGAVKALPVEPVELLSSSCRACRA